MLFGEISDPKLSVVGKIIQVVASTICLSDDNFRVFLTSAPITC